MNDDFEQRLREQRLRQIPDEWRADILPTAHRAASVRHASRVTRHSLLSTFSERLSALLWPNPAAWVGLAAGWLVAFTLNLATRDEPPVAAAQSSPSSPELRLALKQQEQLRAELLELTESRDNARPKDANTSPRSERRGLILST